MLRRKESLENRDRAKTWLLCCRRNKWSRDVARLIAREIFPGFEYISGRFYVFDKRFVPIAYMNLKISSGVLVSTSVLWKRLWKSSCQLNKLNKRDWTSSLSKLYNYLILLRCSCSHSGGSVVTDDEACAILEAVRSTHGFTVIIDGIELKTFGQVFDHLDRTKPKPAHISTTGNTLVLASNERPKR
jgi:hypothetical protein